MADQPNRQAKPASYEKPIVQKVMQTEPLSTNNAHPSLVAPAEQHEIPTNHENHSLEQATSTRARRTGREKIRGSQLPLFLSLFKLF